MTPPAAQPAPAGRASNRIAGIDPMTNSEINAEYNIPKTKPPPSPLNQQELRPGAQSVSRLMETAEERKKRITESLKMQGGEKATPGNDLVDSTEDREGELCKYTDDPEPPKESATQEEKALHKKALAAYSKEMFDTYSAMTLAGEELWLDFTTAFRPDTIKTWSRPVLTKWVDLLSRRGIAMSVGKRRPMASALIDLLYREEHVPSGKVEALSQGIKNSSQHPEMEEEADEIKPVEAKEANTVAEYQNIATNPNPNQGGDPSDDSDSDAENGDKKGSNGKSYRTRDHSNKQQEDEETTEESRDEAYSKGVNGLIKAYGRQKQFTGAWDDDLDTALAIYDTMARMCQATLTDKLHAMPVMLTGDALSFFSEKSISCKSYDEAKNILRKWYNSKEKKSRILHVWQTMSLGEAMAKDPDASQVDVFRKFVARLLSLQKQLDSSYHDDRFLRDRLLSAVNIPYIQETLRDRLPRNSTAVINRVANRLSEKPRTAGTTAAYLMESDSDDAEVLYSLGRSYGGSAHKPPRTPWKKGYRQRQASKGGSSKAPHAQQPRKRLSPQWLRGVRGCFVCGRDHFARDRHTREEISSAIKRLKEKQPSALLTVEDLSYIHDMCTQEEADLAQENSDDDDVHWVENDYVAEEDEADVYLIDYSMSEFEQKWSTQAFTHALLTTPGIKIIDTQKGRNNNETFEGVRLDTCANRASIMSLNQYRAYCHEFDLRVSVRRNRDRTIRGIGGRLRPMGEARIQIPFMNLSLIIDVNFLIVNERVPTLLSMKDMVTNGLDLSIQEKKLKFNGRTEPLIFENYFLIYRWSKECTPYVFYTQSELRTIHKSFGHPSVRATEALLKRAKGSDIDGTTRDIINKISKDCQVCAKEASAPRRFKLTVGSEELRFNYCVQVDTMFIDSRPVLHMVDESTHFCAANFLRKQSTMEIWNSIMRMWSNVYLGPPDFLSVDQGSAFVSKEMKQTVEAHGVRLREAPIENPNSIGIVERYHAPLRRAYSCIRRDLSKTVSDGDCLSLAVFAMNTTTGPEGLCPVLLVFGAMPRPARTRTALSQMERVEAVDKARREVETEISKRRIAFGLRHTRGPKAREASQTLRTLPAGAQVLVWRKPTSTWEGPFKFVSVENETAVVQMPRGRRIFRSTCVKPYPVSYQPNYDTEVDACTVELTKRATKASGSKAELAKEFSTARLTELQGLLDNKTFVPVDEKDIPQDARIFGSRFVDELKKSENGIRKKSRLVSQNYCDDDAGAIATKAPTIQRGSCRLLLSLAVSTKDMNIFSRDVTQAYVQSRSTLERPVYIKAPTELNLKPGTALRVVKPLYGIPESGLHWYITYLHHHLGNLKMKRTTADPCLLYRRNDKTLEGMVALQVDDSLIGAKDNFAAEEEDKSANFKCKKREWLQPGRSLTFNGVDIWCADDGSIRMSQAGKVRSLKEAATEKQFASQRAAGQYIGTSTRPDVCAALQLIAPGSDPTPAKDFKALNDTIKFLKQTGDEGLRFVKIDMKTARLVLVTDASFGNAKENKSQLGYMVIMADADHNANVIQYASVRCKRVTRSVLAAEIHALVAGFDVAYVLQHTIFEILGKRLKIEAHIDSKTVFQVVTKDGATSEKRLQIDLCALKQSYSEGELWQLGWIPGRSNPADSLTKANWSTGSPMWHLMTTNKIALQPLGWSTSTKKDDDTEIRVREDGGTEMKGDRGTATTLNGLTKHERDGHTQVETQGRQAQRRKSMNERHNHDQELITGCDANIEGCNGPSEL